jgi:hypothetical protein
MCKEWAQSFVTFLKYMGECPEGKTLDRINVNRGYEPGNCRWATQKEQTSNTRSNIYVETPTGRMILKDFARYKGISYKSLHRRVRVLGEPPETASRWLMDKEARLEARAQSNTQNLLC